MNIEQEINNLIGERIVLFRKNRKMTRTSLAAILNVTQQQLDKYEKGINRISAAKLSLISRKFEINISYFYDNFILDEDSSNSDKNKEYKKNINEFISYYLSIKSSQNKDLLLSLSRELSKIQ